MPGKGNCSFGDKVTNQSVGNKVGSSALNQKRGLTEKKSKSLDPFGISGYGLLTPTYTGEVPGIIWGEIRASVLLNVKKHCGKES